MTRRLVVRANFLVLAVLVIMMILVGGVTWERFNAARTARQWSQRTYDALGVITALNLALRGAETGQRGYLLTGDEEYLAPYTAALDQVGFLQGELQRLTADSPVEQERLRALAPLLQRKLEQLAQTVRLRRDVGLDAAMRLLRTDSGRNYMRDIEAILAAMTAEQRALLVQRLEETDRRAVTVRWLLVGGTVLVLLILAVAAWLLNRAWATSRQAEREQRSLALRLRISLDSLSQGVGVFDADRRLTNWNECFQVLLELPDALVRTGTPYDEIARHLAARPATAATPGAAGGFLESEEQIRHGRQRPGAPVSYERTRPDGTVLELRRTSMPNADAVHAAAGGFVLTISDMTKRAQAEAVLRESQKMQAIGQLTGGIAHDFNNLLTVILGNLEFVRPKLDAQPALQTRLERAAWAAQRGATLTGQLLAFARKQPLAPAPIDLAAAVPQFVPLLRRTLGEHIDVRYVETAGLWPAMADAAQLESALLNLALNARDAMPAGGRLTIELANKVLDEAYAGAHAEVRPGDYAMLAVSDTGHGMTPEVLARVFEPFFTTKPTGKGTGLGLAMVFGFVKQSGGHVKVYSEPGEGTTVKLYLPRAMGALPAAAAQRGGPPIALPRGSATVLVVEDEAAVREVAVAILAELGYRVIEAADGEEGLRTFGENAAAVDLLLTDVVLPGKLRGRDLAERITAIRPSVKVLYMSGYTENSIVHHGRLDDGVQLIGKPFKREQLAGKVAEVLAAPADPRGR
ncbi:CHASE3 domain-containing protein [Roseomonas sp. NAR14]|uniref:histidine kinase n=1 Tax=Roseomonas acroporae TaxID=2937791 RepID=A0A9X1Y8V3_9PROT|nr:CHASE3 domain-containing protein [Roseomonas acroporae]MCK8785658.1 CHASE3 domain-containing protein [Roseomonas acroporae]